MAKIKIKKTERGFSFGEFIDRYGAKCSIQKSSIATEDCIWLGINEVDPQVMAPGGWQKFEIPGDVLLNAKMHLTKNQVKELLPLLQSFVTTGELN